MRILLIRLGAFGDIIHTLPLAADLAAAGHDIGWCCEDRWASLVTGSPAVRWLHPLPRKFLRDRQRGIGPRLAVVRQLFSSIRAKQYDVVIDAQGLAKSAVISLLSGIPERVGHGRPRARECSWLVGNRRSVTSAVHVIDQQRALAGAIGVTSTGDWHFPLPTWQAEHHWAAATLTQLQMERPWMLNVGAGWPTKVWPEERLREFLGQASQRRLPVLVLWGSAGERAVAERVIAQAHYGVLAPDTDLPRLAALLSRAAVVISGDTGPLHLALAVGVPTVGLFGPVPAERNGPRGRGHRTLQAPGALWERQDVTKVSMGAITPEQVFQSAHEAMADCTLLLA